MDLIYKNCPKCGTPTRRGSGYNPTDYQCCKCDTEFNDEGTREKIFIDIDKLLETMNRAANTALN